MKSAKFLAFILIFLSFHLSSFAQVKNYDAQWKKVDSLIEKKNLPKSALEEVKKIYAQAKKENQDAQVIKALVYMINLQQGNREDNQIQSIKDIEKEIATAKKPSASILKGLLADLYWQYFQNHRYQLYNRTNTVNFNKADIATWTVEDFHKKISELYLQSIKNEQLLKQTKLEPYDAIIIKGNVRYLRPTLYDLLAHHALDYFKNDERDIAKPAYAFEINQPEAFVPAAAFVSHKFMTKDSLSLQHKALLIFQDLIAFHLKDEKPDALIDVDVERIQFAYQNSVSEDKDTLYLAALRNVVAKYPNNATAKQAQYLTAVWLNMQANKYQPLKDTSNRYLRKQAEAILKEIVKDSSIKTEAWANSYNLLQEIEQPSFSFQIEKVNIPSQPFRALVNYKNVETLNFRLIKADENLKKQLENIYDEKFWNALISANAIRNWQQNLPATNDLQQHSVEVKIDGLPVGEYYLLASPDAQFDKKKSILGAQLFYVSNISYINQGDKFFVLHRESGKPLTNATADVYRQAYNYKTSKYSKTKIGTFKSDANGFFSISTQEDKGYSNLFLDITYQNDHLNLQDGIYNYYSNTENKEDTLQKIFFFTDRSIYRPGQTVYFKGIAVSQNGTNHNSITVGYKTKIYLQDANSNDIDSITVTTNEFGSFNGKFQLPQNSLNGRFVIHDEEDDNETSISVEEYKRPKFYVDFEKIKNSYKVNQNITVTGTAKAYAGNNIDGAKVSYRVVRRPRIIYSWFFSRWMPPIEEMEIAHGETTTDKDGKFSIRFTAIPDKKIDRKFDPVFDYTVYADVTDINGETRSGTNRITAGYKSLLLQLNIPQRIEVDSLKTISIRTENMNGEYQPSSIKVSITKLIPEQRLIRKRYWQQPDEFVMNKQEYITYFPHDEYANETDEHSWSKGEIVSAKDDSTRINSQFAVGGLQLKNGYYVVEVTAKNKEGDEVKDQRYFELFDKKNNSFNKPEYLWSKGSEPIEPGEKTTVQVGSSANVFVINQTDKKSEDKNSFQFVNINNEKKTFDYSATEADRGGYGVNFFFVKDNRFYQYSDVIQVPWTNKQLNIVYETFRDKTLPGSEEKWKVKITGYKNEKVAAEMLASMYDASLDQFKMHQWNAPDLWRTYNYLRKNIQWSSDEVFESISSNNYEPINDYRQLEKIYDRLNFTINTRSQTIRIRGISSLSPNKTLAGKVNGVAIYGYTANDSSKLDEVVTVAYGTRKRDMTGSIAVIKNNGPARKITLDFPRKNFNETAFFFPELRTNANGEIEFSFTTPEALTKWKLQTFAHTKDLAFGISQKEMVTQKQLMVQPNMPRFLRQGDHIELTTKIVNLSDSELTGQVQLELFDATTNQSVDGWFMNTFPNQYFTVAAGQSEVVKFPVQVPMQFSNALVWRIMARSGSFSDGEENALPILTNKILVTETLPLPMRGSGTKNFTFEKLVHSGESETLQNQSLTVEYTSNPAWYAVQALPYLMEYPYECAEQTWNRYYANALASKIVNASPRIKQIFEQWKTSDTSALLSNLQKNQELKSVLLEETPWVMQAKSEEQQKKNIALLFDMVRMSNELQSNLQKLKQMQSENGGFVWFKGGPDDRYITQYIVTGIGHLKKLGVDISNLKPILATAIPYLDKKIKTDYDYLIQHKAKLNEQQIGALQIQYLYMRSFFPETQVPQASQTAYNFYKKQSQQYWMKQNKYMQGMMALALNRMNDKQTALAILKSLKETSINNEELGMYWKENEIRKSWFWYYAPIETQSLMIEAFNEISNDTKTVDDLKTWLLKNKQTNNWQTTKATADACYSLLLQGTTPIAIGGLSNEPVVQIKLGETVITNSKTEAGTGYFKQTIAGEKIKPEMGNISVTIKPINNSTNQPSSPSWGALYWQYFEDMDKITPASTPLQLTKKLFIEKNTDRGPVLTPVEENTELHVGDKIKVRIELRVDRDMEYVHMKDMRASALEPVNVLSGYCWQNGLGYYETTKDASTNFFFDHLRKGTYVFEYPLFVTNTGNFSNGITTIQCMYAPEFSAHSEGVRITVE